MTQVYVILWASSCFWLACWTENEQDEDQLQVLSNTVVEGKKAKAKVLKYVDWLVTTCNKSMLDELWSCPSPHPSALQPLKVQDHDNDYQNLVNCVQRHTRCSTAYCLRKTTGQSELQCRFEYPQTTQDTSTIKFTKQLDGTVRATLISH